ncbi:unnamed protein product [Polarella glacialis]|uniref:PDZ domain-containing protein n=1 Tax=Polarella glacialis TaxID=89957 RepID=A0A813M315_POLGL|nr:unnamed protein product [Polarella glacialis]
MAEGHRSRGPASRSMQRRRTGLVLAAVATCSAAVAALDVAFGCARHGGAGFVALQDVSALLPMQWHGGGSIARRGLSARLAQEDSAQLVQAEEEEDEVEVWQQAFALETERSQLLDEQIQNELEKLGALSAELRKEFEGCKVDLEVPSKPASADSSQWSEAYMALRRCNEQMELRISEIRAKASEKESQTSGDFFSYSLTMELGPIRHKGTKFKDIKFDRYNMGKGSKFFFVELSMPLGVKLEEQEIEGVGSVIVVAEIVDGGSVATEGSVRVGDYLRAVTTPQRRMAQNEEGEGEGDLSDAVGFGAGETTKAVLVMPRGFPFGKVMEEISKNKQMDSYAGLAFERPFT